MPDIVNISNQDFQTLKHALSFDIITKSKMGSYVGMTKTIYALGLSLNKVTHNIYIIDAYDNTVGLNIKYWRDFIKFSDSLKALPTLTDGVITNAFVNLPNITTAMTGNTYSIVNRYYSLLTNQYLLRENKSKIKQHDWSEYTKYSLPSNCGTIDVYDTGSVVVRPDASICEGEFASFGFGSGIDNDKPDTHIEAYNMSERVTKYINTDFSKFSVSDFDTVQRAEWDHTTLNLILDTARILSTVDRINPNVRCLPIYKMCVAIRMHTELMSMFYKKIPGEMNIHRYISDGSIGAELFIPFIKDMSRGEIVKMSEEDWKLAYSIALGV